ncbi:MAG TPA: helix-turn-helix domain-containing protein [Pseudonocardiaceae bacterium]
MAGDVPEELTGIYCATYQEAIELVGRRWSGVILRAMLTGATRFSEIRDAIPELTDRMLSERLKELENRGIIERRVLPTTPVRISYHLTPKGEDLRDVVIGLQRWAEQWADQPAGSSTASR